MKCFLCVAAAMIGVAVFTAGQAADDLSKPIRNSDDGRFLAQPDGEPFFWLADVGWAIFLRLTREETDVYLQDRAAKGFNVIQSVMAGGPFDDLDTPNRYGQLPLKGRDPDQPNPQYFEHIDWVLNRAAQYGLRMALLPTWGLNTISLKQASPEFTAASAERYGRWVAERYRGKGVIWVLGGDTVPLWPAQFQQTHSLIVDYRPVYDAMARGIESVQGKDAFITFHPCGFSFSGVGEPRTSVFFADRDWLDMNMLQSSHFRDPSVFFRFGFNFGWDTRRVYLYIGEEYRSLPVRPILDGEPRFENLAVNVAPYDPKQGSWKTDDTRLAAYHAVFAGAAGHSFGNASVHLSYDPARSADRDISKSYPDIGGGWREQLNAPGAGQMRHLKALMLSRPYFSRIPDDSFILGASHEGQAHVAATRDRNGSYMMVYLPIGQPVLVDLIKLSGASARAWWFDPRTGSTTLVKGTFKTDRPITFTPPTHGEGQDWVLVIDDDSRAFPPPGRNALAMEEEASS